MGYTSGSQGALTLLLVIYKTTNVIELQKFYDIKEQNNKKKKKGRGNHTLSEIHEL